MLTNLLENISYGSQSVRVVSKLGLRHFGNFEEQQIHQEVLEQETSDVYLTKQLSTSVLAKFCIYPLLASCNLLV
jgi:hypothetical protein